MHTAAISARIQRPNGVQRLGQALWMMVGERVSSSAELLWADALLGTGGDRVLWEALRESGCIGSDNQLLAQPLAIFLCTLWEAAAVPDVSLTWTLPEGLNVPGVDPTGYADGVRSLIRSAQERLTLLAPYLEVKGIGQLQEDLLAALARGVSVVLVTQDANTQGTWASDALESLRREARGLTGVLRTYTAPATATVLLHSKLVVSDGKTASVGSANLTENALLRNLETGVLVGVYQATEIERVVQRAIETGYVTLVFSTAQS